MGWHSQAWPGLLALLCTGNQEDQELCIATLTADWRAFSKCSSFSGSSLFHANLAKTSQFHTRPMSEVVDLLPAEGATLLPSDLEDLRQVSHNIWSGWGQTRLVEKGNKEVREQESFDSSKKTLSLAK
eukprot:4627644-Lingulodinium_polyedra.AAC.1